MLGHFCHRVLQDSNIDTYFITAIFVVLVLDSLYVIQFSSEISPWKVVDSNYFTKESSGNVLVLSIAVFILEVGECLVSGHQSIQYCLTVIINSFLSVFFTVVLIVCAEYSNADRFLFAIFLIRNIGFCCSIKCHKIWKNVASTLSIPKLTAKNIFVLGQTLHYASYHFGEKTQSIIQICCVACYLVSCAFYFYLSFQYLIMILKSISRIEALKREWFFLMLLGLYGAMNMIALLSVLTSLKPNGNTNALSMMLVPTGYVISCGLLLYLANQRVTNHSSLAEVEVRAQTTEYAVFLHN